MRWRQSLETLAGMGATRFVEVGTGGVLTGLARRTLPDALASAVATPDDLDTLVNAIAGSETWQAYAAAHQGEHLYTSERVVISPSAGVFEPVAGLAAPGPARSSPTAPTSRAPTARRCRWATSSARWGRPRSAPPSPAWSWASWPIPANASPPGEPVGAGCAVLRPRRQRGRPDRER